MNSYNTVTFICIFSLIVFCASTSDAAVRGCSGSCPALGPLKFYEELSCTPVYHSPKECCPFRYNCERLKNRSDNKCYVNGHSYNIDESLRKEDKNPCDFCTCAENEGGAQFACAIVDCFFPKPGPGCFIQRNASSCCPGPVVCPKNPEDRAKCKVDGKIFLDGEYFRPVNEPEKDCFCGPNYKGKNVEPFCVSPKGGECKTELRGGAYLRKKCAPVYESDQSPLTDCNYSWKCPNDGDEIIKSNCPSPANSGKCTFGNLKLNVGDKLNRAESDPCVDCVCELPPVMTCKKLSSDVCNSTQTTN